MKDAKLPLGFRDNCAHLLIPLNQCAAASQRHLSRAPLRDRPPLSPADLFDPQVPVRHLLPPVEVPRPLPRL